MGRRIKVRRKVRVLTEPVIVMLERGTRRQVEALAERERVSLSEVGRRAFAEYLPRRTPGAERDR